MWCQSQALQCPVEEESPADMEYQELPPEQQLPIYTLLPDFEAGDGYLQP